MNEKITLERQLAGRTYGAELELADIDRHRDLPPGCGWDRNDYSMVNSNGIAVDPKGISYGLGGEIQMRPEGSLTGLVEQFAGLMTLFPEAAVNYRSNLHIHVHVPGLKDNLELLKKFQSAIHDLMPDLLPIIEPIPEPKRKHYATEAAFKGARNRYKRRRKSHWTLLTPQRLEHQLAATTVEEFFEREVPATKATGKPMWHAQARCCVNLRQMRETDTIEFRHFPGTTDPFEFATALQWCDKFVEAVLRDETARLPPLAVMMRTQKGMRWPQFMRYHHESELKYLRTCHDGTNKRPAIEAAIREILLNEQK